jgi:hypothetical protein
VIRKSRDQRVSHDPSTEGSEATRARGKTNTARENQEAVTEEVTSGLDLKE